MKELRLLKANEIDVRVGSINEKGATLLLYKDARVDMNILDESGVKWQRKHELINGNLFCTISIWDDEISQWIERQDVGTESNTEKEKGQASDAFKRAGFNFGIGRELYTAPFIWVSAVSYTGFERNGKFGTYDKFSVVSILYDENKEISYLVIKNEKTGKTVFDNRKTIDTKNTDTTTTGADQEIFALAKSDIMKEMKRQNYLRIDDQRAFIKFQLDKETIDTIDDAKIVAEALETSGYDDDGEPGINQDGSYNK